MKIYLDSANLDEVRRAGEWGIVDGVTTNPSLIAKEGCPIEEQVARICEAVAGDVSAPVLAIAADGMIEEGRRLAMIHENVVVKLPMTRDGIKACSALSKEGIRTNVTLCFSAAQALLAAKAGAYVVSPFVGRLDDIGGNGMKMIRQIVQMYEKHGYSTQVLVASLRGPGQVVRAALAGAHIATLPFKLLDQMFDHPLTDRGLDQFLQDWDKVFRGEPAAL